MHWVLLGEVFQHAMELVVLWPGVLFSDYRGSFCLPLALPTSPLRGRGGGISLPYGGKGTLGMQGGVGPLPVRSTPRREANKRLSRLPRHDRRAGRASSGSSLEGIQS